MRRCVLIWNINELFDYLCTLYEFNCDYCINRPNLSTSKNIHDYPKFYMYFKKNSQFKFFSFRNFQDF